MADFRALLLTDVVDSTELSRRVGDSASAAIWVAHDRFARDLLPVWRGREIDKTDGMLLMFESAADATGYAMAYHRGLAALPTPLQARAGLHVGSVVLRENSAADIGRGAKPLEVDGIAKAIAARVMAHARGGQTLLTAEARQALGETRLRVASHGHWRVKGVAEPFELFEVGEDSAPFVAPPPSGAKGYRVVRHGADWLPVAELRHNLPAERDAFIGRRDVLFELARQFDAGARLVSIVGTGGTGKTRLAIRFAWSWLGDFPGAGLVLRPLGGTRCRRHRPRAGAHARRPARQAGPRRPARQCPRGARPLSPHPRQLRAGVALRRGDARALAGSGRRCGLHRDDARGARHPAARRPSRSRPMASADATTLFIRRAQAARPGFDPSAADREAVDKLVRLLDGLPLAVELAAARSRVMAPSALLERMSERFKLLASNGGRHDRQATLRGDLRLVLGPARSRREAGAGATVGVRGRLHAGSGRGRARPVRHPLGALAGRCAPVARRQVLGASRQRLALRLPGERPGLCERTAAQRGKRGGQASLRRGARRRRAMGAYFSALDERHAIGDRCAETDNLVVACRRAVARGDVVAAVGALENAWAALRLRGPFSAGIELAEAVAAMPGIERGQLAGRTGRRRRPAMPAGASKTPATGSKPRWRMPAPRRIGTPRPRCSRRSPTSVATKGRTDACRAHLDLALPLAREVGDHALECELRNGLGSVNFEVGRLERPRRSNTKPPSAWRAGSATGAGKAARSATSATCIRARDAWPRHAPITKTGSAPPGRWGTGSGRATCSATWGSCI